MASCRAGDAKAVGAWGSIWMPGLCVRVCCVCTRRHMPVWVMTCECVSENVCVSAWRYLSVSLSVSMSLCVLSVFLVFLIMMCVKQESV